MQIFEPIYRPQHKNANQLREDFVVRHPEYEDLLDNLAAGHTNSTPQHIVVVGPRGSGKTTLLRRLHLQAKADLEGSGVRSIIFNEEQFGITALYKLWVQVADYLAAEYPSEHGSLPQTLEDQQAEDDYEALCFTLLRNALEAQNQRLLLLIDNFGMLVNRLGSKGQNQLRETLLTWPRLQVVGGSTLMHESFFKYDSPFFEFFKIITLHPLSPQDIHTLLQHLAQKHQQPAIEHILKNNPGRIEALRILTGGVPRTLVLLFGIYLENEAGDSVTDLKQLMDAVTPLYHHRMTDLPAQQAEIVEHMALYWDGITSGELAQRTRMPSNKISAQLKQLTQQGLVQAVPGNGKSFYYQLKERFFNIWYLMQYAPPRAQQRVIWLTRFLEAWNPGHTIAQDAKHFKKQLEDGRVSPSIANLKLQAFAQARHLPLEDREALIITGKERLTEYADEFPDLYTEVKEEIIKYCGKHSFDQARASLQQANLPKGLKLNLSGHISLSEGNDQEAETSYRKAYKAGANIALDNLGLLYVNFQNFEKAHEYFSKAIQKGSITATYNLALLLEKHFCKYDSAKKYYLKSVEAGHQKALINLGNLLSRHYKDYKKAEYYHKLAIKLGDTNAFQSLGTLYAIHLKKYKKAIDCYKAIISKGNASGMYSAIWLVVFENLTNYSTEAMSWADKYLNTTASPNDKLIIAHYYIWADIPHLAEQTLRELLPEAVQENPAVPGLVNIIAFALIRGLKNTLIHLFEDKQLEFNQKLKVHYYAILSLSQKEKPDILKRMGQELKEPVEQMVSEIEGLMADIRQTYDL